MGRVIVGRVIVGRVNGYPTAIVRLRVHFSKHCDFNQLSD